jgi:acyl-CoA thioester hydrolase
MGNHRKVIAHLSVRFRDIDAMGHVNNAVFFTFFEEGRGAFLKEVFHIVDPIEYPFILARMSCTYLKPVKLGDQLAVHVWIGEVGKKSFVFKYNIVDRNEDGKIYAQGESTMVLFYYKENITVPLTAEFLGKLEAYREGR